MCSYSSVLFTIIWNTPIVGEIMYLKFYGYSIYPDRIQTERDDFKRIWEEKERKNSTLQANGVKDTKFIVSGLKIKQIKIKQDLNQPTS